MQGGDDDVDALLAQFALEEKAKSAADVREDVAAPSARVYASFTAHPTSVSLLRNIYLAWVRMCWKSCRLMRCVIFVIGQHLPVWWRVL